MPPDRRSTFAATKPMKTERTHEENQERAYIAASRRSDRSLEARIESARRASEIHKQRTGRALRVTENDVLNEEMYEEEDDDLPTQYLRLSAHLTTSSWDFNRRLQAYIASQHGVRNMFFQQQFPGQQMPPFPMQPNQPLMSPQAYPVAQPYVQTPQAFSPQAYPQSPNGYRHAPYSIPQRSNLHQRAASIPNSQAMSDFTHAVPQATPAPAPASQSVDANRRMSLPPYTFDLNPQPGIDNQPRPPLSRTSTSQSTRQQPVSPKHSAGGTATTSPTGRATPQPQSEHSTPPAYQFPNIPFTSSSQMVDMNPLSMSLPPESQQLVGSALDPNDPRTAVFMAGSNNLPQPFTAAYMDNTNASQKQMAQGGAAHAAAISNAMSASSMNLTLAPEDPIKLEPVVDGGPSNTPPSTYTDAYHVHPLFATPNGFEFANYFDAVPGTDGGRSANDGVSNEPFEFVDWDQGSFPSPHGLGNL